MTANLIPSTGTPSARRPRWRSPGRSRRTACATRSSCAAACASPTATPSTPTTSSSASSATSTSATAPRSATCSSWAASPWSCASSAPTGVAGDGAAVRGGGAALRRHRDPAPAPPGEGAGAKAGSPRPGVSSTPPAEMAGPGPFRLRSYVPGERVVLERNPHYWKVDTGGRAGSPTSTSSSSCSFPARTREVIRFKAGETDLISRLSADNFAALARRTASERYRLQDLGPGPRVQLPVLQPEHRGASSTRVAAQAGLVPPARVPAGRLRRAGPARASSASSTRAAPPPLGHPRHARQQALGQRGARRRPRGRWPAPASSWPAPASPGTPTGTLLDPAGSARGVHDRHQRGQRRPGQDRDRGGGRPAAARHARAARAPGQPRAARPHLPDATTTTRR